MGYFTTQTEIDMHFYSRWEIAVAREQTAGNLAFFVAFLAAVAIDLKYDSWFWNVVAFVAGWWFTIFDRAKETQRAWTNYENRQILNRYGDDE